MGFPFFDPGQAGRVLALVLACTAGAASAGQAPMDIEGAITVDADGVLALIMAEPDLVILDNRREGDFAAGHIEGAVRLLDSDITGPEVLAAHVPALTHPVLFYCNGTACGRAAEAVSLAVSWGYENVHYYALGLEEWRALGLPLATQR